MAAVATMKQQQQPEAAAGEDEDLLVAEEAEEGEVLRRAEEKFDDLEREMLLAMQQLRLRAGLRFERSVNRGLLAVCGLILCIELVVNKIEDDSTRMTAAGIACAAMLAYVLAGSRSETDHKTSEEEFFRARVKAARQRRRSLKKEARQAPAEGQVPRANVVRRTTTPPQMRAISEERTSEAYGVESEGPQMPSTVDGWVIKTEAELASVEELRDRLSDLADECTTRPLDLSDCVLIRFIRARKTVKESEAMFRAAAKWRRETQPDDLLKNFDPSRTFRRWVPGGFCYSDREGTPVYIDRIGRLDVPTCMKRLTDEEYLTFAAVKEELIEQRCIDSQRKLGRPQYQAVVICDVRMLSMRHWHTRGLRVLKAAVGIDDNYYPERLKAAYVINAPKLFAFIWRVVKNFLDVNTRAKVQIHADTPTEDLLRRIPPEHLPKCYGGELVIDGDPECLCLLGNGGIIPDDYDENEDDAIGQGHFLRSAALAPTLALERAARASQSQTPSDS